MRIATLIAASAWALGAQAAIIVGQTAGFTGPVADGVKEITQGAKLYIDATNASGGIGGQPVELVSLDDKFNPEKSAENARKLIVERGAVALFLSRGTPHTEAMIPVLDQFKVPLIGPSTGAASLQTPTRRYVFNVRPSYRHEAARAVGLLAAIGMTSIGVAHVDDSFGRDALAGLMEGFTERNLKPAFVLPFDRANPDVRKLVEATKPPSLHAIIVVGTAAVVRDTVRGARAEGSRTTFVTLSNNASGGFIKALGEHAKGTIVTQVFPDENSQKNPMVREAYTMAKAAGIDALSPAMIEGFAAAKVLVAALRRAGPKPSGESIRAALVSLGQHDIGGISVNYSPTQHLGVSLTDLSIVKANGKFFR